MSRGLATELYRVAARIFEEIAFLFPRASEAGAERAAAPGAATCVAFAGPFNGYLVLSVSNDLLPAIAANMLGEDKAPPYQQQLDALGELANVICGNVLPRLAGSSEEFRLDAPRTVDPRQAAEASAASPTARARLELDEGEAELRLFVDAEPRLVVR